MERQLVLEKDILEALKAVGVQEGQSIMVHTSLSSLGFVCGGAQIVIEALIKSVGENGTIITEQTFSEIGLETANKDLITHLCFFPVQKTTNSSLIFDYLLRIQIV